MELTETQAERWKAILGCLVDCVPPGGRVVVDGAEPHRTRVADRLAEALHAVRAPRTPSAELPPGTVADGPAWREHREWDVVIWLRTPGPQKPPTGAEADVVLDLIDPGWPVLRRVAERLAGSDRWFLTESRAFFAAKAASWDAKFGDDMPAYTAAVDEARLPSGGRVVDVGCGTGRALTPLRAAVGPSGTVVGLDLTPEMLAVAAARSSAEHAPLVLADARRLPFGGSTLDGVFAAGLLMHLPDPGAGLDELARVVRPGGRLVLFHPSGRAALAARHGRTLRPDEPLSEQPLRRLTAAAGWHLDRYDDAEHRFLAITTRQG